MSETPPAAQLDPALSRPAQQLGLHEISSPPQMPLADLRPGPIDDDSEQLQLMRDRQASHLLAGSQHTGGSNETPPPCIPSTITTAAVPPALPPSPPLHWPQPKAMLLPSIPRTAHLVRSTVLTQRPEGPQLAAAAGVGPSTVVTYALNHFHSVRQSVEQALLAAHRAEAGVQAAMDDAHRAWLSGASRRTPTAVAASRSDLMEQLEQVRIPQRPALLWRLGL